MNTNSGENEIVTQQTTPDTESETESDKEPENKSFLKELFDWLETLALAFAFVLVVFTSIFRLVTVDGRSMHYTLNHNDKLVISDILYEPECGDIVVVSNQRTGKPIIKRVIATEGQTVDIDFQTWQVTVDGVALDEPYVNDEEKIESGVTLMPGTAYTYPHTVSEGCVFVLGDNRNHSSDSRVYGEFTEDEILGRVLFRLFPFDKIGAVKPATQAQIAEIKESYYKK